MSSSKQIKAKSKLFVFIDVTKAYTAVVRVTGFLNFVPRKVQICNDFRILSTVLV
jgi:hypothetical protein